MRCDRHPDRPALLTVVNNSAGIYKRQCRECRMDEKREDDRIFQYEEPSEEDWHREQIEIHPERYR